MIETIQIGSGGLHVSCGLYQRLKPHGKRFPFISVLNGMDIPPRSWVLEELHINGIGVLNKFSTNLFFRSIEHADGVWYGLMSFVRFEKLDPMEQARVIDSLVEWIEGFEAKAVFEFWENYFILSFYDENLVSALNLLVEHYR